LIIEKNKSHINKLLLSFYDNNASLIRSLQNQLVEAHTNIKSTKKKKKILSNHSNVNNYVKLKK